MQPAHPSVLVVEPEEQAHGVLQAALEARGIRVLAARVGREAAVLAGNETPSLVVADDEADVPNLLDALRRECRVAPPMLVLGEAPRFGTLPSLRKPYDCRTLIRRIEALLAACDAPQVTYGAPCALVTEMRAPA